LFCAIPYKIPVRLAPRHYITIIYVVHVENPPQTATTNNMCIRQMHTTADTYYTYILYGHLCIDHTRRCACAYKIYRPRGHTISTLVYLILFVRVVWIGNRHWRCFSRLVQTPVTYNVCAAYIQSIIYTASRFIYTPNAGTRAPTFCNLLLHVDTAATHHPIPAAALNIISCPPECATRSYYHYYCTTRICTRHNGRYLHP